mmetsp:Transcript_59266/g.128190  ORF Transcript_59266/g.128190 Transcript_59266/m.128190 type:complete len:247 (-) Transcript_59266:589-1329(-)
MREDPHSAWLLLLLKLCRFATEVEGAEALPTPRLPRTVQGRAVEALDGHDNGHCPRILPMRIGRVPIHGHNHDVRMLDHRAPQISLTSWRALQIEDLPHIGGMTQEGLDFSPWLHGRKDHNIGIGEDSIRMLHFKEEPIQHRKLDVPNNCNMSAPRWGIVHTQIGAVPSKDLKKSCQLPWDKSHRQPNQENQQQKGKVAIRIHLWSPKNCARGEIECHMERIVHHSSAAALSHLVAPSRYEDHDPH